MFSTTTRILTGLGLGAALAMTTGCGGEQAMPETEVGAPDPVQAEILAERPADGGDSTDSSGSR